MRFLAFLFIILASSCTITAEDFYSSGDYDARPATGYNRLTLFENYLTYIDETYNFGEGIENREENWLYTYPTFKEYYPEFDVELVAFNQLPDYSYTWQERIFFADAVDLIKAAVNSDIFMEEMKNARTNFMDNDQTKSISGEEIANFIRSSKLHFFMSKDVLDSGVLAQATVGGYANTIWFEHDVDYTKESLKYTAMILLHEMMHNLGWLHASNVPCGVEEPFINTVKRMSEEDVSQYIKLTPYYEQDFLDRIRVYRSSADYARTRGTEIIQKDYAGDFSFGKHNHSHDHDHDH